jgi:hypothetical protein
MRGHACFIRRLAAGAFVVKSASNRCCNVPGGTVGRTNRGTIRTIRYEAVAAGFDCTWRTAVTTVLALRQVFPGKSLAAPSLSFDDTGGPPAWRQVQVQVQVCFTSVCGQVQPLDWQAGLNLTTATGRRVELPYSKHPLSNKLSQPSRLLACAVLSGRRQEWEQDRSPALHQLPYHRGPPALAALTWAGRSLPYTVRGRFKNSLTFCSNQMCRIIVQHVARMGAVSQR